jgi:DNA (cytosine-5)-methyltransferase 1
MRPLLLDLFCGAGGAAMGYWRAGFDVVGVDIKPQPHYPFEFIQADALEYLEYNLSFPVDAIHASPPCQAFSQAVKIANRPKHADLLEPTRLLLEASDSPYVIENVPRAPLLGPITLCGSSFGLPIRRHRLFESNVFLMSLPCTHSAYPRVFPPAWNRSTPLRVLSISGGYQTRKQVGEDFMDQHKAAMGIDWDIAYDELSQAIPPAYTEFIGGQLLERMGVTPQTEPDPRPAIKRG